MNFPPADLTGWIHPGVAPASRPGQSDLAVDLGVDASRDEAARPEVPDRCIGASPLSPGRVPLPRADDWLEAELREAWGK